MCSSDLRLAPLSAKAAQAVSRAKKPAAEDGQRESAMEDFEDDDEGDLRAARGCPRGHLVSEAKISALYRSAGCDYR